MKSGPSNAMLFAQPDISRYLQVSVFVVKKNSHGTRLFRSKSFLNILPRTSKPGPGQLYSTGQAFRHLTSLTLDRGIRKPGHFAGRLDEIVDFQPYVTFSLREGVLGAGLAVSRVISFQSYLLPLQRIIAFLREDTVEHFISAAGRGY